MGAQLDYAVVHIHHIKCCEDNLSTGDRALVSEGFSILLLLNTYCELDLTN